MLAMKMHKYLYLNRPPSIGCQPDNWVEREGGLPMKVYQTPRGERTGFGIVTYKDKLSTEQVWKYDLLPLDEFEHALYFFWMDAERDVTAALDSIAYYAGLDKNECDQMVFNNDVYNLDRVKYARVIVENIF